MVAARNAKTAGHLRRKCLGSVQIGREIGGCAWGAFADDAEKMNSGMMNLGSALGNAERIDGGVARKR